MGFCRRSGRWNGLDFSSPAALNWTGLWAIAPNPASPLAPGWKWPCGLNLLEGIGSCYGFAPLTEADGAMCHGLVQRNVRGLLALNCCLGSPALCWSEHGCSRFQTARCASHRRDRSGRRLPRRISARTRVHRARRQAAIVLVQHRACRSSVPRSARWQRAISYALRGYDGFDQPDPADAAESGRPKSTTSPRRAMSGSASKARNTPRMPTRSAC